MTESFEPKIRVNGSILPQYNESGVIVLGRIQNVNSNGTSLTMKTSDDKTVNVIFEQPFTENMEGIIEVHGTCHGSQIRSQSYFLLAIETVENFDMEGYDEAVKLIHATPNPWRVD